MREFLRDFAQRRPRWGWRRAAKDARQAGWQVNDKRFRRLWRDEGLKLPYKRCKKRLTGVGSHVGAMCPIRPNALWAMDFFDVTVDGRSLKLLNVIDEFTRECPAIVVDRSTTPTPSLPPSTDSPPTAVCQRSPALTVRERRAAKATALSQIAGQGMDPDAIAPPPELRQMSPCVRG